MQELILQEENSRFVLYPIRHSDIWALYKKAEASFWTFEEIDLDTDVRHWNCTLNLEEKRFISYVLAFFAASDGIVVENLCMRFMKEVKLLEARVFYGFQMMMENIHSETYVGILDRLISNQEEKYRLLDSVNTIPCIRRKAEWTLKWINKKNSFGERLVAFAIVEGVFFSSSFCAIFWLKKRGLMPGLTFSNELISRDEGLHVEFACLLYSMLSGKLDQVSVFEIMEDAVLHEKSFVNEALSCSLIGMNSVLMNQYVEFVSDTLLTMLGYNRFYDTKNPFEWMELISLQGKTNFFERRTSEYQKMGVSMKIKEEGDDHTFTTDADF